MNYLNNIEEFDTYINNDSILVDFYADWCGPCKSMGIVLEEYLKEHPDAKILKVDVDKFKGLARKYKVISIPAIKLFQNGEVIKEKTGLMMMNELVDFIGE